MLRKSSPTSLSHRLSSGPVLVQTEKALFDQLLLHLLFLLLRLVIDPHSAGFRRLTCQYPSEPVELAWPLPRYAFVSVALQWGLWGTLLFEVIFVKYPWRRWFDQSRTYRVERSMRCRRWIVVARL